MRQLVKQHLCDECLDDVEVCSSWTEYILAVGLSLFCAFLGCFLFWYWSFRWGLDRGQTLNADVPEDEILINTYKHALWSTLAYVFINAVGVLAFRICCIYHRRVTLAIHIICFVVTIIITIVAYGYAGTSQRLNTERPLGGRTIYGIHATLGLATVVFILVEFLQGIFLVMMTSGRRICNEIHKAMGVAVYVLTLMALVAAFTQQQTGRLAQAYPTSSNDSSSQEYKGTPWTTELNVFAAGCMLIITSFFIIIFILLRNEINVNHTVIVADDEIIMLSGS